MEGRDFIEVTQVPLSPVRYESLNIDITHMVDEASVRDTITSGLIKDANSRIDELGEVCYLVYDIWLTGYHANINQVEEWTRHISDFEKEITSGTIISVRKVNTALQPEVQNLEELSKQPSPAGILAATILAIENGHSTPFLEGLIDRWNRKLETLNNYNTYQPLLAAGRLNDKDAKKHLSAECKRLLSELIAGQEN